MKYSKMYGVSVLSLALIVAASASGICAGQNSGSMPAVTNSSGGCGSASGGGCGSGSGGCGAATSVSPAPKVELNLTASQKKKLAEIDRNSTARSQKLEKAYGKDRDELYKLIDNPRSGDAAIRRKMYEVANAYAALRLNQVFADRAKDRVYTAKQRKLLATAASGSEGCGCGSASNSDSGGGCGSSGGGCGSASGAGSSSGGCGSSTGGCGASSPGSAAAATK